MKHLDERQRAMLARMGMTWIELAGPAHEPEAPDAPKADPEPSAARVPESVALRPPQSALAPQREPTRPTALTAEPLGPRPSGLGDMGWHELAEAVSACTACKLCRGRRQTVFGVGDRQANWLIVGEAPGENEDMLGEPFVGQAGKLLDNMLKAVGRSRQSGTYIANVLKCRPPNNRNPEPEEVAQCEPFLRRQIELLQPRLILAMGRFAVQSLLKTTEPIGRLRGRVHHYEGVPVIVTYHPAYLLRNLPDKAKAWEDLCLAMTQTPNP